MLHTDDYKDLLLRYIDPDNLPACYGGKLTDPDGNPKCVTMVSTPTKSKSHENMIPWLYSNKAVKVKGLDTSLMFSLELFKQRCQVQIFYVRLTMSHHTKIGN